MKDYEEKTIWTSETLPLMVSYHNGLPVTLFLSPFVLNIFLVLYELLFPTAGKMQHSVWFVEIAAKCEAVNASPVSDKIPHEIHRRQISFRRIWQGKCSLSAASKVVSFLGYDESCFRIHHLFILHLSCWRYIN